MGRGRMLLFGPIKLKYLISNVKKMFVLSLCDKRSFYFFSGETIK